MTKTTSKVAKVIKSFVDEGQSFISLDVYCKLGTHFDQDIDNPIHEQVREAYSTHLMPNYLCKWVCLSLEGGGYSNCWKYYLPQISVQSFKVKIRADGSLVLSKRVLGTFSLLECDMTVKIEPKIITYHLCTSSLKGAQNVINASNKIVVSSGLLKRAVLQDHDLVVKVYPNKIEVLERDSEDSK
jgi:hypothetical protein